MKGSLMEMWLCQEFEDPLGPRDLTREEWCDLAGELTARAEAAEARLAYALREVRVIRESLAGSVDPYEGDPYDRGAYAIAEDIEEILTGRVDNAQPEQGEGE